MQFRLSTSAIGPWLLACGCGLALLLAVWVRFLPAERAASPAVFRTDSAFHLRMLSYMISEGKLPEDDPLFWREPPRKLSSIGPPNLYILTAAAFRCAWIPNPGPDDFVRLFFWFNALCGALPVVACGWVMWEVSGGKRTETFLGMILCAVASPMVLRSHAGIFRHETIAVGLLLVFAGILFHGLRCGSRPFWNWMAAICLYVGMGFWRLFPFLAALVMLGVLAVEFLSEDTRRIRSMIDLSALGCLVAMAAYAFYRTDPLPAAMFCLPVLAMPFLQRLIRFRWISAWGVKLRARKGMLPAAWIALIIAGSLAVPALRVRWLAVFSSAPLPLTGATLYGMLVEELAPLPLREAFTAGFFLYLPVLLAAAFLLRGRWKPSGPYRAAAAGLLIFMTLTVLFLRFVSLAFPFLIVCLVPAVSGAIQEWKERRPRLFGRVNAAALVILLLVPALGFYVREDLRLAEYLLLPDREQLAAYEWLRANVPADENVVCDWSHGYEIQTYSGRRTVMDGYLEDPRNRARILGLLRVLLSADEAELIRYMRQHHGNYLLLDRAYLFPACRRLNLPWQDWFEFQAHERYSRLSLKPTRERNNYLRCLFDPTGLRSFQLVFHSGNYIVLRLKPAR